MARRIANHASPAVIARREDFQGHNLSGEAHEPGRYVYEGRLPEYANVGLELADYIVRSYSTPIAWHIPGEGWVVPITTYSVSTSKHQGYARQAAWGDFSDRQEPFERELRLTRTQRDALGTLRVYGAVSGFSRRTLQALVDAGFGTWPSDGGDHVLKI